MSIQQLSFFSNGLVNLLPPMTLNLLCLSEAPSLNVALFRRPAQQRKVSKHLGDGPRPKCCTRQCLCLLSPCSAAHLADLGHGLLVGKRVGLGQSEGHSQKLLSFSLSPKSEGLDAIVIGVHARRLRVMLRELAPALCKTLCQVSDKRKRKQFIRCG